MSSKRRNLSALVFLINLTIKVNLFSDCINFDIDAEKPSSGMLNKVYVCMYVCVCMI